MKNMKNHIFSHFSRRIVNSSLSTLFVALTLLSFIFPQTASATEEKPLGPDLHKFWDKNCAECHGHSADFARKYLKVVDGKLQGPLHKESFQLFLHNHYLVKNQEDAIYDMLLAETETPPRFKTECRSCHKKAADFIRESFVLKEGELLSNKLNTPIGEFLKSHQGLKTDDIVFFKALLTRVANEVYRP